MSTRAVLATSVASGRSSPSVVVVGGGLSGVIHAIVLARYGARVALIESGNELVAGWHRCGLDAGLRIPARSGIAWADRLVFEDTADLVGGELCWHELPCPVPEGHVVGGALCERTPVVDARLVLAGSDLQRARAEVIACSEREDPRASARSFAERLRAMFGETVSAAVFAPAIRAVVGDRPEALSWRAADNRLPLRVVLAAAAETEHLQRRGFLGDRLGHPDVRDAPGYRGPAYLYPRRGGIGRWTKALILHCALAGVTVRTGVRVSRTVLQSDRVRSLVLSTGEEMAADAVVLAAPPSALGANFAVPCDPMPTRRLNVAHLVLAGSRPSHGLHWFVSYDPATLVHRAAFLDRIRGEESGDPLTSLLVEHRGSEESLQALIDELRALGALDRSQRLLAATPLPPVRFPMETVAAYERRREAAEAVAILRNAIPTAASRGEFGLAHQAVREAAHCVVAMGLAQGGCHDV